MRGKTRIVKQMNKVTAIALSVALASCFLFPANAYSAGAIFLVDIYARHGSQLANPALCSSQPIVASGLRTPAKLIFTQHSNLLVAELGSGPNSGRLSIVDPATGQQRTLLDGLPSGLVLPSSVTYGPSGLAMRGRTLYVTIGGGDSTLPGSVLNTRIPNPNPSSPLFSSVLAVDFSSQVERTTSGFMLTVADHLALQSGSEVNLDHGGGDKIKIRLVADFPDYVAEPLTAELNNVRASDPSGLVIAATDLYVVDSNNNLVRQIDIQTGEATKLTEFAPVSPGRSEVNAVPVSIRFFGDQLLVSLLTSDPFPISAAQVRIVDPATGSDEPFITGLTTAFDVLPIRGSGRASEFLTLELSADMQAGRPGRLRRYASPDAAPVVVADCLNLPTSMARDERTGDLYITEIFTGRIVKVATSRVLGAGNNLFGFEPQPISATAH